MQSVIYVISLVPKSIIEFIYEIPNATQYHFFYAFLVNFAIQRFSKFGGLLECCVLLLFVDELFRLLLLLIKFKQRV